MWLNVAAVSVGAAMGALVRWGLGSLFAKTLSWLALGTLMANLIGALLIGLIAGFSQSIPGIPTSLRLFLITGLLGGLTTFSGFSLEIAALVQEQRWINAASVISLHVIGSVCLTLLGLAIVQWLR